jgi:hypothetical protein
MSAAANNRNKVRQVDEYLKYIVKNHGGNVKNYKLINNSQALRKVIKMNNISKISNEEKLAKIYPFMRPNFFDPNTLKAMTKKKSILRHVGGFLGGLGGVGKGVVKGALGAVTGGAVGLVSGVAAGATIGAGKGGNALKLGGHEVLKRSGHKNISNAMKRGNINYIFNKGGKYVSNAVGYTNNNSPKEIAQILDILFEMKDFSEFTPAEKKRIGEQIGILLIPLISKYAQLETKYDPATGNKIKGKASNVKAGIIKGIREYIRQGKLFANLKPNNNAKTVKTKLNNAKKYGEMTNNAITVAAKVSDPIIKGLKRLPLSYKVYSGNIGAINKLTGRQNAALIKRIMTGPQFVLAPSFGTGGAFVYAVGQNYVPTLLGKGLKMAANKARAYNKKLENRNAYFRNTPVLKNYKHKFNIAAGLRPRRTNWNVKSMTNVIRQGISKNNLNKLKNNHPLYLNSNRQLIRYLKDPTSYNENRIRQLNFF